MIGEVLRGTLGLRAALAFLLALVSAGMVVFAAVMPRTAEAVVLIVFGGYALLDGVAAAAAVRAAAAGGPGRPLVALEALVGIAAAIVAVVLVRASSGDLQMALRGLVAGWAIAIGIIQVVEACGPVIQRGRPVFFAVGGLSLVLGALLLGWPSGELLTLVWRLAVYALLLGVLRMLLTFRLR